MKMHVLNLNLLTMRLTRLEVCDVPNIRQALARSTSGIWPDIKIPAAVNFVVLFSTHF